MQPDGPFHGLEGLKHLATAIVPGIYDPALADRTEFVFDSPITGIVVPLEAQACGTPVVATTASPLPELLAGGGVFVAPGDEAALRGALARLLDDGGRP